MTPHVKLPRRMGVRATAMLAGAVVVGGMVLLGAPSTARACKCAPPPPPRQALDEAHAVFEGRLVGQTAMTRKQVDLDGDDSVERMDVPIHVATFEILAVWKGDGLRVGDTIEVETSASSASCGRDYSYASEWVIYADATSDDAATRQGPSGGVAPVVRFSDMACTRSGPSDETNGGGDVAGLDAIARRIGADTGSGAPPETSASREGCALTGRDAAATGAAGLLAIAMAFLSLSRRVWRRSQPTRATGASASTPS